MVDRLPLGIHRSPLGPAATSSETMKKEAFFQVGQGRQVGLGLQFPGSFARAVLQERVGEGQIELRRGRTVIRLLHEGERLLEQLQRTAPIAGRGRHHLAPAPIATTPEFPGNQEPHVVGLVEIRLGHGLQRPPIVAPRGDDAFEELIDLLRRPQVQGRLQGRLHIDRRLGGTGLRIHRQLPEQLPRLFEVPLLQQLLPLGTRLGRRGFGGRREAGHADHHSKEQETHHRQHGESMMAHVNFRLVFGKNSGDLATQVHPRS